MAQRLYIAGPRIIISKPGYNADPSLPDSFKVFDSAWGVSGLIIATGQINVPNDVNSVSVNFPPQHHVPAVEAFGFYDGGERVYAVDGYCTHDTIVMGKPGSQYVGIIAGHILYVVYGLSQ